VTIACLLARAARCANFGRSAAATAFSKFAEITDGIVPSADATRVWSVRKAFASAGFMVFMAVSIFPPTGANIDVDIASRANAIIMPPCA
jgi:hypothetical protein